MHFLLLNLENFLPAKALNNWYIRVYVFGLGKNLYLVWELDVLWRQAYQGAINQDFIVKYFPLTLFLVISIK